MGVLYDAWGEAVEARPRIDYEELSKYIEAWPDKAIARLRDRLADDDFRAVTQELYDYICEEDKNGPAFEEWRKQ
jgi:hypothetical protein